MFEGGDGGEDGTWLVLGFGGLFHLTGPTELHDRRAQQCRMKACQNIITQWELFSSPTRARG